MANTYTQLYIQFVFAVKYRASMLNTVWDERLRLYITAIAQNNGHKVLAINNMPDHLHLFVGLNPNQSVSQFMQVIKSESSEWINKQHFANTRFNWQEGYGAFTYSRSQIDKVVQYVINQQEHHKKVTFLDEYREFLQKFQVEYDEQYIFKIPV